MACHQCPYRDLEGRGNPGKGEHQPRPPPVPPRLHTPPSGARGVAEYSRFTQNTPNLCTMRSRRHAPFLLRTIYEAANSQAWAQQVFFFLPMRALFCVGTRRACRLPSAHAGPGFTDSSTQCEDPGPKPVGMVEPDARQRCIIRGVSPISYVWAAPKTTPEAVLSTSAAEDAEALMELSAQPENNCYLRVTRRLGLARTLVATPCLNAWVPVHARPQSHGHLSEFK